MSLPPVGDDRWWSTPRVRAYLGYKTVQGAGVWIRKRVKQVRVRRIYDPDYRNRPLYWGPDVITAREQSRQGERNDLKRDR